MPHHPTPKDPAPPNAGLAVPPALIETKRGAETTNRRNRSRGGSSGTKRGAERGGHNEEGETQQEQGKPRRNQRHEAKRGEPKQEPGGGGTMWFANQRRQAREALAHCGQLAGGGPSRHLLGPSSDGRKRFANRRRQAREAKRSGTKRDEKGTTPRKQAKPRQKPRNPTNRDEPRRKPRGRWQARNVDTWWFEPMSVNMCMKILMHA